MKRWALSLVGLLAFAWIGWQDIPGEFLQRPRNRISDYGGIPNDGKDDTAAIVACRRAVIANEIYWVDVDGFYDVDGDNVLHPEGDGDGTFSGTRPSYGINWKGRAQNYCGFILHRDAGNERWLYDSGSAATTVMPGWNRVQFENLWFRTDQPNIDVGGKWDATYAADVNGFRIGGNSLGVDKGFIFRNCRFNGFKQPVTFSGTAQTDSFNAYGCWVHNCGPIIFENDQAILCNWEDCHIWYPTDMVWIKNTTGEGIQGKGGAGNTYFSRCDIINEAFGTAITAIAASPTAPLIRVTAAAHGKITNDYVVISGASSATNANNRWQVTVIDANTVDLIGSTWAANGTAGTLCEGTTAYYTVRIDDGAAFSRSLVFQGGQTELRQTYKSRLVHKRGNSSLTFTNQVLFDGCNLSVSHGAESGATGREYLTLGGYTNVKFRDCAINERMGVGFYDVNTSSIVSGQYQPLVEFEGCMLGPTFVTNLATRITFDSGSTNTASYGRVISRNGRSLTATNLSDNYQFDFDYGMVRGGAGEPPRYRQRISLKQPPRAWPTQTAGVGASEYTVTLAPYAKIVAAGIERAATGSSSTSVGYRLGSNDKTITYVRTGPYRVDGHHRAYADHSTDPSIFPIEVGTDANLRQVRLWIDTNTTFGATGGDAWVEVE